MFQQFVSPNYAGFWLRVAAYLIDMVLVSAILCPLGMILGVGGVLVDGGKEGAATAAANLISYAINIVVWWLYSALLESSSWQGTVGKKALGIRVTDDQGNRIGFGKATARYFSKLISSLICLIGFIMVAFTERKQGLHDMIAGTFVLQGSPSGNSINSFDQPPPPPPSSFDYGAGM